MRYSDNHRVVETDLRRQGRVDPILMDRLFGIHPWIVNVNFTVVLPKFRDNIYNPGVSQIRAVLFK
jgi:hypothetical protein